MYNRFVFEFWNDAGLHCILKNFICLMLLCNCKYRQVHKYLIKDTIFIFFPFKYNHGGVKMKQLQTEDFKHEAAQLLTV